MTGAASKQRSSSPSTAGRNPRGDCSGERRRCQRRNHLRMVYLPLWQESAFERNFGRKRKAKQGPPPTASGVEVRFLNKNPGIPARLPPTCLAFPIVGTPELRQPP